MNWQNPSASEKPWFTPTVTRKLQNHYNYLFTIILYKNGKFQQKKKVAKQSFSASTISDFWQPLPAPSRSWHSAAPAEGNRSLQAHYSPRLSASKERKLLVARNHSSCFPKYFCHYCFLLSSTRVSALSMLEIFGMLISFCPPRMPNTLQKRSQWCAGAPATVWIRGLVDDT